MDFTGYLEIYRNGDEENTGDKDTFDSKILLLKENDILKLVNLSSEQHFSQPPPRYNEEFDKNYGEERYWQTLHVCTYYRNYS